MSAMLLLGETLLRLPSARIPAGEARPLRDAAALLAEARRIREASAEQAEADRAAGHAAGRAEALDELRASSGEALKTLEEGLAAENARREAEVARTALAVIERMLGELPDVQVAAGLARTALAQVQGRPATVYVSADVECAVQRALQDAEQVTVIADPAAGPLACRVEAANGCIIADLDVQLAALAKRWGLADG